MGSGWALSAPSGVLNQVKVNSARQRKRLFRIMLGEVYGIETSLTCEVGMEVGQKVAERLLADQLARLNWIGSASQFQAVS